MTMAEQHRDNPAPPRWYEQPLHPLFVALFPVLFLYTYNLGNAIIPFREVLRPAAVTILFAGLTFLAGFAAMRKVRRAAVFASLITLLFFSYGHLVTLFKVQDTSLTLLNGALLVFLIGVIALLLRSRQHLARLTALLNVVGLVL